MDMVWVRFFSYHLQLGHQVWRMDEALLLVGIAMLLQEIGLDENWDRDGGLMKHCNASRNSGDAIRSGPR